MKQLLFILSLAFILASCGKEKSFETSNGTPGTGTGNGGGSTSGYYIKFKKDGTSITYSKLSSALIETSQGITLVNLMAVKDVTNTEGINLTITSNVPIAAGNTYKEDESTDYSVNGQFNPNIGTITYVTGFVTPSALPLTVKITTLTATEITGTFSGAFYEQDNATFPTDASPHLKLTEGEFKLKLN